MIFFFTLFVFRLVLLLPFQLRLTQMLLTWAMDILMPMEFMGMLMCLLDPAPVLTLSPRELFLIMVLVMLVTTMARDLLMPNLRLMLLILVMDILMPMELTHTLPMFHSDPAPVLTQSPKDLTLGPRESFLTMDLVMLVTTMARDLLMPSQRPMLLTWAMDTLMLMELTHTLPMFHLDPALGLTQSPKVLTL